MAARIREQGGDDPELIAGAGGVFDVALDGDLIFSKHQAGRFPEEEEILRLLES